MPNGCYCVGKSRPLAMNKHHANGILTRRRILFDMGKVRFVSTMQTQVREVVYMYFVCHRNTRLCSKTG